MSPRYLISASALVVCLLATGNAAADQPTAMRSGCLGCHQAENKLVGPSFRDIAAKYAGQEGIVDTLAGRVKAGKSDGLIWGSTPMPPNPSPESDIKKVIEWMLTHK